MIETVVSGQWPVARYRLSVVLWHCEFYNWQLTTGNWELI